MNTNFCRREAAGRGEKTARCWRTPGKALALAVLLLLPLLALGGCGGKNAGANVPQLTPERVAWIALRDADAAIESLTKSYEQWRIARELALKNNQPPVFTARELENFRAALNGANEALAAGEGAYSAWQALAGAEKPDETAIAEARRKFDEALNGVRSAVTSARMIFAGLNSRTRARQQSSQSPAPFQRAGVDIIFLLILLGEFASALLGGKKGAISEAAADLIAAVAEAHQQATGEEISLAQPALRERIAARRARLAAPAPSEAADPSRSPSGGSGVGTPMAPTGRGRKSES